jgi:hypothetical protein
LIIVLARLWMESLAINLKKDGDSLKTELIRIFWRLQMDSQVGIVLLRMVMTAIEIKLVLQIKMLFNASHVITSIAFKIMVSFAILHNKTGAI